MDFILVAVFLLTLCSSVLAPPADAVLNTVNSFNPLSPEFVVNFYSFRNAIDIHTGCYKWCFFSGEKEKCYEIKQAKCAQLDKFSYWSFIAYQLAKWGMGKMASFLPVPQAVIDTGLMVAANGVAAVVSGVGTVAEGVVTGAKVAMDGVAAGGKLAADGVRAGTALATDGVNKGVSVATGTAGGVYDVAAGGVGAAAGAAGGAYNVAAGGAGALTKGVAGAVGGSFKAANSGAQGVGGMVSGGLNAVPKFGFRSK